MADVVTFDPVDLRIIEINTGSPSVNEISLVEIYSEWKDWLLADPTRMRFPKAFRTVGGDPVSETEALGVTYFLNTGCGWRLRPAEYDHQVIVAGNLWTDPAGDNAFTPTLGGYTVAASVKLSTLVESISVASVDTAAIIQSVEDWGVINFAK